MAEGIDGAARQSPAAGRWRWADGRIGLGYFWFFAAIGSYGPFAAIWFLSLGLDGAEVGVLVALPALGAAFAGPLWGAAADARSRHRIILCGALAVAATAALAATRAAGFWPLLLLLGVSALAAGPIAPLLDAFAVTIGERLGRSYGNLRVWGSIGYTLAALLVGRLMGQGGSAAFLVAYAAFLGLTLATAAGLPDLGERTSRPLLGGLHELRRNRPFVALLLVGYLTASGAAIMNGFLGVRLLEIGGTTGLVGLAIALGAASEWPVVAFGGWLLARFGAARLVALAIVVYAVRFVAFATIPVAAWVLPVQLLHGLSFGAFLIASVTLAHRLAGPAHAAAAQALLAATSFGFGSITGSLIGGALLERVGLSGLFLGAAGVMAVALALFAATQRGFEDELGGMSGTSAEA